ncbi:MAG: DNA-binding response regulator [Phototrophicales bacterium]|nr:MAG: DNA-binding response regulator [Phototrophicales bacterium]
MKQILIAEDERTVREVVRKYLEREGFSVLEAADGLQAIELLQHPIDLMVLDVMLPGVDGLAIMRHIRQKNTHPNHRVPVIMLTARTEEEDRITGFEVGVDDYVTKPFSPRELVMRVRAVLRRFNAETEVDHNAPLIFKDLRIEPQNHAVYRSEQPITLTAKEFELLLFMARSPRQVFTRAQLLNQIWGYEFYGDESTVTVHMHRLRDKIEPDPANPTYIHTVWGVGYKFEVN